MSVRSYVVYGLDGPHTGWAPKAGPFSIDISLPEGFSQHFSDVLLRGVNDLVSLVGDNLLRDLFSCASLEPAGLTEHRVIISGAALSDFDRKAAAAFGALRRYVHEGRAVTHTNSSSVATEGESRGEVATPSCAPIVVHGVRSAHTDGAELIVTLQSGGVRTYWDVERISCDGSTWTIFFKSEEVF